MQEAQGASGTTPFSPDVTDTTPIAMAAGAGKIALVNTTAPLGCNGNSTPCPPAALATIVDLVGYGNANFFEGLAAAHDLTNTTAALRASNGCLDSALKPTSLVSSRLRTTAMGRRAPFSSWWTG